MCSTWSATSDGSSVRERRPAATASSAESSACCQPSSRRSASVRSPDSTASGRIGKERPRGLEVGRPHEDLASARGGEVLERRVDRLRVPVRAFDAVRLEEPAEDLGLRLVGDHRQHDLLAWLHPRKPTGGSLHFDAILFVSTTNEGPPMRELLLI